MPSIFLLSCLFVYFYSSKSFMIVSHLKTNHKLNMENDLSGLQLAYNSIPIAVGIFVLTQQNMNVKDKLEAQENYFKETLENQEKKSINLDKFFRETLEIQLTNVKEKLEAQEKFFRETLANQEKNSINLDKFFSEALLSQDKLYRENI